MNAALRFPAVWPDALRRVDRVDENALEVMRKGLRTAASSRKLGPSRRLERRGPNGKVRLLGLLPSRPAMRAVGVEAFDCAFLRSGRLATVHVVLHLSF